MIPAKAKTKRQRFIAAASDSLTIETIHTQNPKSREQHLGILHLKGAWRANDYNQLVFEASLKNGRKQKFVFKGSWELNKNQQIEYASEDGLDTLTLKGRWSISCANRLVYILDGNSNSRFEFKAQFESASLRPGKGKIRYRLGIGVRQNRQTKGKLFVLYGQWKFGRNLDLIFAMDYEAGCISCIKFGAQVVFGRNKCTFDLQNELGEPLGISFTLTHRLLKFFDSEAFIRLKSRSQNQEIEAGITIPF